MTQGAIAPEVGPAMRRKCLVVYQYDPANRGEAGRYHTFPAAIVAVIPQVLDSTLNNLHSPINESGAVITHDPRPTIFGDGAAITGIPKPDPKCYKISEQSAVPNSCLRSENRH